jgi:hypothetical protein
LVVLSAYARGLKWLSGSYAGKIGVVAGIGECPFKNNAMEYWVIFTDGDEERFLRKELKIAK